MQLNPQEMWVVLSEADRLFRTSLPNEIYMPKAQAEQALGYMKQTMPEDKFLAAKYRVMSLDEAVGEIADAARAGY